MLYVCVYISRHTHTHTHTRARELKHVHTFVFGVSVPISGGVINPLRSFGLSVVYSTVTLDHWTEQWVYYVSSAAGAVLAAIFYK